MKAKEFFINWGVQAFIATDQWINAVVTPALGGGVAWADETLSARTYRCASEGRFIAKVMQPLVNFLFLWQGTDEEVNKVAGKIVTGHCERAFYKEKLRRNLPPEYRE